MTRISKSKISNDLLTRIYYLFFEVITRSKTREGFTLIVEDLLSPTEKVMIAKRIAILYLLIKELSQREISQVLKVSTSTVAMYALLFHKKDSQLKNEIVKMLRQEKVLGFLDDIFAELFIQPRLKIGHYRLQRLHEKAKEIRRTI